VNKAYEGGRTVVDIIKDGGVQLVLNTTEGAQAVEDSRSMRAVTLADKIPYYTTLAASHAAAQAMKAAREGELGVRSLQGTRRFSMSLRTGNRSKMRSGMA
jgi:carbamoyl-phosphate synthase large subunit